MAFKCYVVSYHGAGWWHVSCRLKVVPELQNQSECRLLAAQNAGPAEALSPHRVYFPRQREVLDAAYNVPSTLGKKKTWSLCETGSKYKTTDTVSYDSYLLEMLNFDEDWIYIFVERWSVVLSGTFLWRDIFSSNLHTRRVKSWLLSSSINNPYLQEVFYHASIRYAYFSWTFHVLHEKMNTLILLQKNR